MFPGTHSTDEFSPQCQFPIHSPHTQPQQLTWGCSYCAVPIPFLLQYTCGSRLLLIVLFTSCAQLYRCTPGAGVLPLPCSQHLSSDTNTLMGKGSNSRSCTNSLYSYSTGQCVGNVFAPFTSLAARQMQWGCSCLQGLLLPSGCHTTLLVWGCSPWTASRVTYHCIDGVCPLLASFSTLPGYRGADVWAPLHCLVCIPCPGLR